MCFIVDLLLLFYLLLQIIWYFGIMVCGSCVVDRKSTMDLNSVA